MGIPVLVVPAFNRHDLLLRALRSIDVPVDRGLVIDSGMNLEQSPEWPALLDEMERLNLFPFTPPFASMGYGGGINFAIMQTADAPWWMWVSNDVKFEPGHLETVVSRMEETTAPRVVTGLFTWGGINRAAVERVGLIDEYGFFPIYYDDNDYAYRCRVAGVEWIEQWSQGMQHGDHEFAASLTIKSDQNAQDANSKSFPKNHQEYLDKWGGRPGEEQFSTPWNSGMPLWVTRPSVRGRTMRQWRQL